MTQFVTTTNSRRNGSIDLIPKNIRSSDVLSILFSKSLREVRKPNFNIGDWVCISKIDWSFRKGYKPRLTQEVFEIAAIFSKKPPTYILKDELDEVIRAIFVGKSWSKSLNNEIVYSRVGLKCICATISRQYPDLFYNYFTRATESGRSMGGRRFRIIQRSNVPNCHGGKMCVSWQKKLSKSSELYYLEPRFHPSITGIVEAMNTLIQQRHNHSEICITDKVSRSWDLPCKWKIWFWNL